MSWYQTIPETVEAKQYHLFNADEFDWWIDGVTIEKCVLRDHKRCLIATLEGGVLHICPGDYVVKDEKGNYRVDKPEKFEGKYIILQHDDYGD